MNHAGIIAEYNPLHEGHIYHIHKTRETLGEDSFITVAMSGSFMQRGIPAFFDKFSRTKQALDAGADMVIELPVGVSTSSAEVFASGAVRLLSSLGITHLSFGCECGDLKKLNGLSLMLENETEEFGAYVRDYLSTGSTYPAAVKKALANYDRELAEILEGPNNTLATEYLKAIRKICPDVTPLAVKRLGAGYNDLESASGEFTSSSALRVNEDYLVMPHLENDDFSEALFYKLIYGYDELGAGYADVNPEFVSRLKKNINKASSFSELAAAMKSRNVTMARVNRSLYHIMLGVTDEDVAAAKNSSPEYIRILGIRESAGAYLKDLRNRFGEAGGPALICRLKTDSDALSENAFKGLKKDLAAYELYRKVWFAKNNALLPPDYESITVV